MLPPRVRRRAPPRADASRPRRQVYHSNLEDPNLEVVCGCAILPMKTTTKGPAPVIQDGVCTPASTSSQLRHPVSQLWHSLAAPAPPGDDIIDEVLGFFKANVLFKSFQPAGSADRVLLYLTLYTTQALAKCVTCETAPVALKALTAMAHENFKIPGDVGFTLGTFYSPPGTAQEGDLCRAYFKQAREELGRWLQRGFQSWRAPSHRRRASRLATSSAPHPLVPVGLRCPVYRVRTPRRLITKVYLDGSPSKLWLALPHVHTVGLSAEAEARLGLRARAGLRLKARRSCFSCTTQAFAKRKFMNKTL